MMVNSAGDGLSPATWAAGGFTLLELVMVVMVLGVLIGLAIPSYRDFMMKSRRTEAKELLWTAAQRQQQFFTLTNTYTTDAVNQLQVPTTSSNGYYTLNIAAGHTGAINSSYSLSATPVGGTSQAGDTACGTFIMNSLGLRTVSGSQTTPPCW